jgi:alpha-L-fucosidase 2
MGWLWLKTANAWFCQHYWEHYAFTGDKQFLRTRAYPLLLTTCKFWEHHLKTLPDGSLVVPDGWSPEHGPFEDGVSFDQELIWDLFTNYIDASVALGVDLDYRARVSAMRDKLVTPKIGHWGQLQEWMEDKDDPADHHRHTSHLIGVFPGREYSVAGTPAMIAAAKVSLLARGSEGDVTEWAFAWRTALFARMHDPERACGQLTAFFAARNSCVNLFGNCPPMQIDGDFGMTAAICEMLLQSQNNELDLLPALPAAWKTGAAAGLRARGGFIIDESWQDGALRRVTVHSAAGGVCRLQYSGKTAMLSIRPGHSAILNGALRAAHQ